MPHAYTEDELVEQPAIGLFEDLGWETVSAAEEIFGTNPQPSPLTSSISASLRFASLGSLGPFTFHFHSP